MREKRSDIVRKQPARRCPSSGNMQPAIRTVISATARIFGASPQVMAQVMRRCARAVGIGVFSDIQTVGARSAATSGTIAPWGMLAALPFFATVGADGGYGT